MEGINETSSFWSISWKGAVLLAVGLLLVGWLLNTPQGLLGKADAVGYAVCHRIAARSFQIGDRPISLCARCSGMYLGALLGLGYQAIFSRRRGGMPSRMVAFVLALLVAAFGVDGLNSYLHLFPMAPNVYEPQNWLRLFTGTGMGLAISAVIFPAFHQTLWADWDARPALPGWKALGGLIVLAAGLDLLVLLQNPVVLYTVSLISAGSVLIILTMVYSMAWLLLFRADNRFRTLSQAVMPLVGGFGVALLQIVILDLVRYLLTGTWEGFHIG